MAQRDWQGELSQALGLAADERAASGGDAGGVESPAGSAPGGGEVTSGELKLEHRLARIESLLAADLDRLGEAVLGATITRLDARLSALVDRIDAMLVAGGAPPIGAGEPGEAGAERADGPEPLAFAQLPSRDRSWSQDQYDELTRRLDTLAERLDHLARRQP